MGRRIFANDKTVSLEKLRFSTSNKVGGHSQREEIEVAETRKVRLAVRASESEGHRQPMPPRRKCGGYANNVVHQVGLRVG